MYNMYGLMSSYGVNINTVRVYGVRDTVRHIQTYHCLRT